MYLSIVKIYPVQGSEHKILDVLDSMKGPTSSLMDCLNCSVTIESGKPVVICYTEQWRSSQALEKHLRSNLYGRLLEAIECSGQSPEVFFYEVKETLGLELIEKIRIPFMTPGQDAGAENVESRRTSDDYSDDFPTG